MMIFGYLFHFNLLWKIAGYAEAAEEAELNKQLHVLLLLLLLYMIQS